MGRGGVRACGEEGARAVREWAVHAEGGGGGGELRGRRAEGSGGERLRRRATEGGTSGAERRRRRGRARGKAARRGRAAQRVSHKSNGMGGESGAVRRRWYQESGIEGCATISFVIWQEKIHSKSWLILIIITCQMVCKSQTFR